jgi:hypothetical protein
MNYLHTNKGREIASFERLASGGGHISTDGDDHLCTDDSPAAAIISACTPLRKGPRPRLPTGGGGGGRPGARGGGGGARGAWSAGWQGARPQRSGVAGSWAGGLGCGGGAAGWRDE